MNRVCTSCGNANSAEMTFCLNCGHSLAASSSGSGVGSSYPNADNSAMFSGGMPPALPTLPARGAQQSSRAWVWILGVVGVLGVLLVAGLVGMFALLSSISKPQDNDNTSNRTIVSTSPSPNANRGISFNSNLNSNGNRNSNSVTNTNSNKSGGGSLTENMTLGDVAQENVGDFRLEKKEPAPEWKTDTNAVEAENHYYTNSKGIKPTVTVVRYATAEQAKKNLRDSMKMYDDRKDTTSAINDCIDKATGDLIGITSTVREKKSNTYRRYWTDGKFLFVSSIVGDKKPAEDWMSSSKY